MHVFRVKPEPELVLRVFAEQISIGNISPALLNIFQIMRLRFEITPEQLEKMPLKDPRVAALIYAIGLPKKKEQRDQALQVFREKGWWQSVVPELSALRGVSLRPEFCPWEQGIRPLVGLIDRERESTDPNIKARALVEMVERFGAAPVPKLLTLVLDLTAFRLANVPLPQESERLLQSVMGQLWSADYLRSADDVDHVLDRLKQEAEGLKRDVLADRIPERLESSPLHMDLFNSLIITGSTYGSLNGRAEKINKWRQTVQYAQQTTGEPSVAVPSGYTAETYEVRRISRRRSINEITDMLDQEKEGEQSLFKRAELITKIQKRLAEIHEKSPLTEFLRPFIGGGGGELPYDLSPQLQVQEFLEEVTEQADKRREQLLAMDRTKDPKRYQGLEKAIQTLDARTRTFERLSTFEGIAEIVQEEMDRLVQEAKTDDAKKRIAPTVDSLNRLINNIRRGDRADNYGKIQSMLEAVRIAFGKDVLSAAELLSHDLMLMLMHNEAPGHFQTLRMAYAEAQGKMTPILRSVWAALFQEEVLEHFLDPSHTHTESRTIPFTPGLQDLCERMWRVDGIREKLTEIVQSGQPLATKPNAKEKPVAHLFWQTVQEARRLERDLRKLTDPMAEAEESLEEAEVQEVTFHPCHGLGRIFCGDIANACFDSKAGVLADNDYHDLDAVLMSAKEPTGEMRIIGSFLLIRATEKVKEAGVKPKKVLIVRALNPTEAVIQRELRADDVVAAAKKYVTAIARASGCDQARFCVSPRGEHSTNRQEIKNAMDRAEKRGWKPGSTLVQTKETAFNGYEIYPATQTAVVWERETA